MEIVNKRAALDRIDGDEDLYNEIVQLFLEVAPQLTSDLEAALKAGDSAKVVLHAHSLKSSAANIGADFVRDLAQKLEFAGRSNKLASTEEFIVRLKQELESVRAYFHR